VDESIIESTQELERVTDATFALKTYYGYMRAWIVCTERIYGEGDKGKDNFLGAFLSGKAAKKIQGGAQLTAESINAYCRGRFTFKVIEDLPIREHPDLALSANLWLPVLSYYTVFGMGSAAMIALNMNVPKSHSSFRAAFSSLLSTYFPVPFCGLCMGGPETKEFSFQKLDCSITESIAQKHYDKPELVADTIPFVGKSLSTTRSRFLEVEYANRRRRDKCSRLSRKQKVECSDSLHPTSVCDLLYRMRLRSNYDNVDMYIFGSDRDAASRHYEDLRYLTGILVAGLDALIERRVGRRNLTALNARF
jgi:hypothetical protein